MNRKLVALQLLTECLANASDPGEVADLHTLIRSGQIPWEAVVELANNHLLTPALWVALQRKGLHDDLPDDLRDYLHDLHQLSIERNRKLRGQLIEAVTRLNEIDIEPVLLKGAMHLVSDLYPDPGVRIMSDIDLLVQPGEVERSVNVLQEAGYGSDEATLSDYPPDHHQSPPLHRRGEYGALEVHRHLMGGCARVLSTSMALSDARPLSFQDLRMKVLSPTHRILHNILHSQIVDRGYAEGVLPLRSLLEVTTESLSAGNEVDWSAIRTQMDNDHRGKVLRGYCYMLYRLFNAPLPQALRGGYVPRLHYWRCRGQLGWRWLRVWGRRYGRFSADNIRQTYSCEHDWIPLNRARLKLARHTLSSFVSRHQQGAGADDR